MVTISDPARLALRSLRPEDRRRVKKTVAQLGRVSRKAGSRPVRDRRRVSPRSVQSLGSDVRSVRVTPQLRVLYRLSSEAAESGEVSVEVLDVLTADRLAWIRESQGDRAVIG